MEKENDGFIDKLAKLASAVDDPNWRRDLDAELANLRKHFIREIHKVSELYEAQIRDLKKIIIEHKKSPVSAGGSASDASHRIKLDILKFRGLESERPIKFLSELKKYLDVVQPNFSQLLCLISQALEADAKDWWYINENEVKSYEDFAERFQTRYWSSTIQRSAKRKIEYGQYHLGAL